MALKRRSVIAIGVFVLLAVVVAAGQWYENKRVQPGNTSEKDVTVHVTNAGDRGPGTLREALFLVAGATGPRTISIEIPSIKLETALPALVSGRGVKVVGQTTGTVIDAQALNAGPVFDISGPNTAIEQLTISKCPAAAILVRSIHFRLSTTTIESCDVGVEVAENASDTLLERNHFTKNRVGIRFAASGHNTAVANNEFKESKDAGLWAVRSAPDSHDDVIGVHDNKFTEDTAGIVAGNIPVLVERNDFINAHESDVHVVGAGAVIRGNRINGGAAMGIVAENASGATIGDKAKVSTAVDNTIIEAKFNGIDVIGDSPILRRNQVLRAHAFALHVEDFQPPNGQKVQAQPFLENNNFGNSPISTRGNVTVASQKP
jgi:parallel beta-helix repeat protein